MKWYWLIEIEDKVEVEIKSKIRFEVGNNYLPEDLRLSYEVTCSLQKALFTDPDITAIDKACKDIFIL